MPAPTGGGAKPRRPVLVVDDDADIREVEEDVLKMEGYPVLTASHGGEALEILETAVEDPCLILLDLMMPVMDGITFLKTLRERMPHRVADVLVVSADMRAIDRVREVGVDRVLRKPFSFQELIAEVHAHCNR